jgi:hypothetical protein
MLAFFCCALAADQGVAARTAAAAIAMTVKYPARFMN